MLNFIKCSSWWDHYARLDAAFDVLHLLGDTS
jgi:hypothetical protein